MPHILPNEVKDGHNKIMPYEDEDEGGQDEEPSDGLTIGFEGKLRFYCHGKAMEVIPQTPKEFLLKCFLCNRSIEGILDEPE